MPAHSDHSVSDAPALPATAPPEAHGASRVVLVTGAARRLGRAIAVGLAQRGWDVAVHYGGSQQDALETVGLITALGRRAIALQADLDDAAHVAGLLDRAHAALGHVDAVVNNAARFEFDDPAGFSPQALQRHLGPNLSAPLTLAQGLHARCERLGGSGAVVNLLDQKLDNLNPDFFSYTLTKAALLAATRMMAMSFAPRLRVNAVSPGATLASWTQDDAQFQQAHRIALLERSSRPDDIVQAVAYLLDAAAVTGVNLVVDGGQHLMPLGRDVMFLTPEPNLPPAHPTP